VRIVLSGEEAVCFLPRGADSACLGAAGISHRRQPLELRSLAGDPVDGLYFRWQRDLVAAREALRARGTRVLESDVKPIDRYLMERFVAASVSARGSAARRDGWIELTDPSVRASDYRPALRVASVDIETGGLDAELYSIAVSSADEERVLMVCDNAVDGGDVTVATFPDERALLEAFLAWLRDADPDVLIGWNVVAFDLDFLERRCRTHGIAFAAGRGGERAAVLAPRGPTGTHVARVPGRVVLDGIELLRASFRTFESYELESVARELLGRGKEIAGDRPKLAEIRRLYREDRPALARYNLEDCRLVREIFDATGLLAFAVRRAELTGLALDRQGGSVAAFDNLYLPRLHRRGRVAPDVGDAPPGGTSPGGYVLDSKPGLYDNVLLLDFKSLYPSIIRTFRIDPLGLAAPGEDPVPGFDGGAFAREGAILPELIEHLWAVRDEAKRAGDAALSQAVKILMNSFYGVLGASGCRFHDHRLASSITRRGHEIIRASRDRIGGGTDSGGHTVIYGDTDSLFVLLGAGHEEDEARAEGEALAADLNAWWRERIAREHRLESRLEVEFEALFLKFLMPTVRGDRAGSKKRYAGLARGADGAPGVVFRGLESVRTDWTPLARRFQRELYRRVFLGEAWEGYVKETLAELLAGRLDHELVYAKRLRRPVGEYTRHVPPHVQAARKLGRDDVRRVRYVITAAGPEPVRGDGVPRPDYDHYRERQLAPAANSILQFLGTSFEQVTDAQLEMF